MKTLQTLINKLQNGRYKTILSNLFSRIELTKYQITSKEVF